jgi:hypothetical protein
VLQVSRGEKQGSKAPEALPHGHADSVFTRPARDSRTAEHSSGRSTNGLLKTSRQTINQTRIQNKSSIARSSKKNGLEKSAHTQRITLIRLPAPEGLLAWAPPGAMPRQAGTDLSSMLSYMLHLFSEARIVLCKAHARKNPACPQIWACENPALI